MVYKNKPLNFVSFPTNIDDGLSSILGNYGNFKAFGVITALFAFIGRTGGYYAHWNELAKKRFLHEYYWEGKVNDGLNYVNEIVMLCLRTGIFDKEIFKKYGVLTGHWPQRTFNEAGKKRTKTLFIDMNYVLKSFYADYLKLKQKVDFFNEKGDLSKGMGEGDEVELEEKAVVDILAKGDNIDCSLRTVAESTPLIERFKLECPTKIVDCDRIPAYVDIEKLIEAVKVSSFLSEKSPNFTLNYMCGKEIYYNILQGKYAVDWNKSKKESNKQSTVSAGKVSKAEEEAWANC